MKTRLTRSYAPAVIALASSLLLAACGGGGGGNGTSTFTGKIIDGYIYNAKVCLDLDSSLTCDDGEPYAFTGRDGDFEIPYQGDATGFPLLAEIGENSYDADDKSGETWVSIKDSGKEPFNLAAPVTEAEANGGGSDGIVITPLTTLVTHEVLSDSTKSFNADAVEAAADSLKRQLGTDKDIMKLDFVAASASGDSAASDLHDVAKVVSVVLGDMKKQLKDQSVSLDKTAQIEVAKAIKDDVLVNLVAEGALTASVKEAIADKNTKIATSVRTKLTDQNISVSGLVTGKIEVINRVKELGESKTVVVNDLLSKEGLWIAQYDDFNKFDPLAEEQIGEWTPGNWFSVNHIGADFQNKVFREIRRYWFEGAWVKESQWGFDYILADDGSWVVSYDDGPDVDGGEPSLEANCATFALARGVTAKEEICFATVNVGGKTISRVTSNFCDQSDSTKGTVPASKASCEAATFKDGSIGFDLTRRLIAGDYLRVDVPRRSGDLQYHYGQGYGANNQEAKTIEEFLDGLVKDSLVAEKDRQWRSIWDGFAIRVKSYDSAKKSGVLQWQHNGALIEGSDGESTFQLIEVGTKKTKILKVPPALGYHKIEKGEMTGRDFIFAEVDGRIWLGEAEYQNTREAIKFGGFFWAGNKQIVESMIEALGISQPFPYEDIEETKFPVAGS